MEHITVYYRQGSSDKVYVASIQPKDGGHLVLFQFGRRGSALQAGQKTPTPVTYPEAKTIYDKLVREKLAKGYTPGENGAAYQQSDNAGQSTGILPQLLNAVEATGVPKLIRDPAYWMQEKFDGRRLLLRKEGDIVIGINRTGRVVELPEPLIESAGASHNDFLVAASDPSPPKPSLPPTAPPAREPQARNIPAPIPQPSTLRPPMRIEPPVPIPETAPQATPRFEEVLQLVHNLREVYADGMTQLRDLSLKLRLLQRGHKTSEREMQSVRHTLRSLQGVRL